MIKTNPGLHNSCNMKQAVLYKKLTKELVQCQACSWKCTIAPDQTGICGIRLNQHGKLYLMVYGMAVGMCLDPVEKKPLYHFLPGTNALSFGTLGCDFGCLFCQNWTMSQTSKELKSQNIEASQKVTKLKSMIELYSEDWPPGKIVDYALQVGAKSIAYTYNEPVIFVEYAHDTAKIAKAKGLKNIFVSNGFESEESLAYMEGLLDAVNVDLKSFNADFYQKIVKGKLQPVLDNITRMFHRGIHIEVTTLVIPSQNDSEKELKQIAEFLAGVSKEIPWHISAFHPAFKMPDVPSTPRKTLEKAYQIGQKAGLKYVYVGNVLDAEHCNTNCPKCHEVLVNRSGYLVNILPEFDQVQKKCHQCGARIAGVWN